MAAGRTQILIVSIVLAIAALLAALLFPTVILPLLPPLRPLAAQLLVRLRDVFAFLAFTTAIAAGIFSTHRKDAQSNKKKMPFLEQHPLGSIFGEPGHGETEHSHAAYEDVRVVTKKRETKNGGDVVEFSIDRASSATVNGSLLQKRSARLAMEAAREHKVPIFKEDNGISTEPKVQKKLHRKSSSLDDGINYEPEVDAARPITPDSSPPPTTFGKNKLPKRVSFSVTSPPTSSSPDEITKQQPREDTAEKQSINTASPGDLTRQADAYIAKVKEQLRMQRLESFQRYRRRVS